MPTQYSDLSHTLFPQATDDESGHSYMSDITSDPALLTAANNYNTAVASGNAARAAYLLDENPDLANCIFNADKYNWMRDAIIAMERYYLNDVQSAIQTIAAHTVGLDDTNSAGSPTTNGYSISKITSMVEGTSTSFTLTASSWSGSAAPYTYTLNVSGVTSTSNVDVRLNTSASVAQAKAWAKAMVLNATQSSGKIILKAYGKITSDVNIPIIVTVHK